ERGGCAHRRLLCGRHPGAGKRGGRPRDNAGMKPLVACVPRFQPRIWGSRDLRAWYPDRGLEAEPIGEAWLSPPDCPVLIKMLFPRERLSVQVHPDDAYAAAHGLGRGKTEAWYVVEAAPEARLGVGLRPGANWRELEAACRAGRGAEMLDWIAGSPGEVIYIPAGTVHAIGGGVVLCEVQQPSDNTFRLDDYGRGRELHLEHGLAVARASHGGRRGGRQGGLPLQCEFFSMRLATSGRCDARRWMVNLGASLAGWPRGCALELAPGESFVMEPGATALE